MQLDRKQAGLKSWLFYAVIIALSRVETKYHNPLFKFLSNFNETVNVDSTPSRDPRNHYKSTKTGPVILNSSIDRKSFNDFYTPFRSSRRHLESGAKSYVCCVNPTNLTLWFEAPLAI